MVLLCILLLLGVAGGAGAVVSCSESADPNTRCLNLIAEKYCLSWRVLEGEGMLEVTMVLETGGMHSPWMAVGVSPAGGMRGADIVAVYKAANGEWVVSDLFGVDYEPPVLDERQHTRLVKAEMTGSVLTGTVRRPLDSCEFHDNAVKKGAAHPMIWALGEGVDLTAWEAKHSERGTARVVLWEDTARPLPTVKDSGVFEVKLQMPRVEIPASPANSYMCMTFDLQELSGKDFDNTEYHMVEFAPLLEGAPGLVHHILLMSCPHGVEMYQAPRAKCPEMEQKCPTMIVVWAVGGTAVTLPDEAGLQIGKGSGKRLWMQMHYYNPTGRLGAVDSSGLTLKVTSVMRKQHAGVLALGPTPSLDYPPIPAGEDQYLVVSSCGECMGAFFEQDEVSVVGVMAHAHFAGQKVETYVIRNGKNIGPLYEMKRYDYNHQLYLQPRLPTIQRGDVLETQCVYNTLGKDKPTYFGDGSHEEMCFSFVLYYPRQPRLGWCYDRRWDDKVVRSTYKKHCNDCRGSAKWNEWFAEYLRVARNCSSVELREARAASLDCPPCAANGTCSTKDYVDFWQPWTFCNYMCAVWENTTAYMCSKGFADPFPAYEGGPTVTLTDVPAEETGCSSPEVVRKVSDNCKVHTDCPTGKYCRNGRKILPEADGLLWCTDCVTCCKRQDAVGSSGETDRLYRCPASCACQQSPQSCAREGEVLCRGCCAAERCVDNNEDGRKLLQVFEVPGTCSDLTDSEHVTDLCNSGIDLDDCGKVGISQCNGGVFLRDLCPVLCKACPKCSLNSTCSQCTPRHACNATVHHFAGTQCSMSTCPWPTPVDSTPPSPSPDTAAHESLPLFLILLPFLALAAAVL